MSPLPDLWPLPEPAVHTGLCPSCLSPVAARSFEHCSALASGSAGEKDRHNFLAPFSSKERVLKAAGRRKRSSRLERRQARNRAKHKVLTCDLMHGQLGGSDN